MNESEIKQLLENVEVKPSARCWNAIESQLTAGARTSAASEAAKSVSKAASHALSSTAKIIIVAVGAAAIATATILFVVSESQPEPQTTPIEKTQTAVLDTAVQCDTVASEMLPLINNNVVETYSQASSNQREESLPAPTAAPVKESAPAMVPNAPAVSPVVASKPVPSASVSTAATNPKETEPKTGKTASEPTRTSISSPAKQTQIIRQNVTATTFDDPVIEQAEAHSELDFSQPIALTIPNVITPNGDGYNDFFVITGIEQCDQSRLLIRNRSGAVVFQTIHYQNNWGADGLPEGTYFYQFVYTIHGIEETRTGTLTILR